MSAMTGITGHARRPPRTAGLPGAATLWASLLPAMLAAVTVELDVDPPSVPVTDPFKVSITVRGEFDGEVEWPEIEENGFEFEEGPPQVMRSFQSINFRRSSAVVLSKVARPTRAGLIRIDPVTVRIGGESYSSRRGAAVRVRDVTRLDFFFLELEASRDKIYLDQRFTVELQIFARKLSGRYAETPPFPQGGRSWPRLEIPWFAGVAQLESEDLNEFAERFSPDSRGEGFPINNYSSQRFFDSAPLRFELPRSSVRREGPGGEEAEYFVYTLEKPFWATKPGTVTFDPVTARGYVFTDEPGRRPEAREVVALSGPLTVEIRDAPLEGRPPTYTGAIGEFTVSAEVLTSRPKVWVGEPLTLKLTVTGVGRLESVGPIPLKEQEKLPELFRIHEEPLTGVLSEDRRSKEFTYGIRARTAEVDAIPPIAFSYFDPEAERYVTVTTDPLPIDVEQGEEAEVRVYDLEADRPMRRHRVVERALYPIYDEPEAVVPRRPQGRVNPVQLGLLVVPPLVYVILLVFTLRHRKLTADPGILRARHAARRARATLAETEAKWREASSGRDIEARREAHAGLGRAITEFVADRVNRPAAGLTAAEATRILDENGVPAGLRDQIARILDTCENARYGSPASDVDLEESIRVIRSSLKTLEGHLR